MTRIADCFSSKLHINCSIAQVSGIGPSLNIFMDSDLQQFSPNNHIFKFADDTNLLVPEQFDVTKQEELANVVD